MIITCDCGLFMYFCEINKFLQSFLTNLCLGFKCSKFTTSCVNVSSGPWANALCGDLGLLRMTYLVRYLLLRLLSVTIIYIQHTHEVVGAYIVFAGSDTIHRKSTVVQLS